MKKYILIAGKTMFRQGEDSLKNMLCVDINEIVDGFGDWSSYTDFRKAEELAVRTARYFLSKEATFLQETTLFDGNVMKSVKEAKKNGYIVEIYYLCVESSEIIRERIEKRMSGGGRGVLEKNLEREYEKNLTEIIHMLSVCDRCFFFDNTEELVHFATYEKGEKYKEPKWLPNWFKRINQKLLALTIDEC